MIKIVVALILLVTCFTGFSQINATTSDGQKVVLNNDGTWKYVENEITIALDTTKNEITESTVLCYETSFTLAKFFGEEKGKIRCKSYFSNEKGIVKMHFQWDVPVSPGYKYFGKLYEGQQVVFININNQRIVTTLGSEVTFESNDKYNFSKYTGLAILSVEQIQQLLETPILSIEMSWKKRPEIYQLSNPKFFIEQLKPIL